MNRVGMMSFIEEEGSMAAENTAPKLDENQKDSPTFKKEV